MSFILRFYILTFTENGTIPPNFEMEKIDHPSTFSCPVEGV